MREGVSLREAVFHYATTYALLGLFYADGFNLMRAGYKDVSAGRSCRSRLIATPESIRVAMNAKSPRHESEQRQVRCGASRGLRAARSGAICSAECPNLQMGGGESCDLFRLSLCLVCASAPLTPCLKRLYQFQQSACTKSRFFLAHGVGRLSCPLYYQARSSYDRRWSARCPTDAKTSAEKLPDVLMRPSARRTQAPATN